MCPASSIWDLLLWAEQHLQGDWVQVVALVPPGSFLTQEVKWKTEPEPGLEKGFSSFTLSVPLLPVSLFLGFCF